MFFKEANMINCDLFYFSVDVTQLPDSETTASLVEIFGIYKERHTGSSFGMEGTIPSLFIHR